MPQVDLSSVCVGGASHDRKVSCETLAVADYDPTPPVVEEPQATPPLDYAPESFWLSKDAELDWLDRNAFIERKDSGKGSISHSNQNPNLNLNMNSISGSQRYSVNLKSKASMIGLPKPQKTNYADAKNRRSCRPASIRLFPKRSGSVGGKPAVALTEPSSPKVSCMGRVRSRKDRSLRGKNRKNQSEPGLMKSKSKKGRKIGFWKNLKFMFRSKGNKMGCKGDMAGVEPVGVTAATTESKVSKKKRTLNFNSTGGSPSELNPADHPCLGAVKRFSSGRRSDAWAADLEVNGAQSEPLDRGPIWRRRERAPPAVVDVDRDLASVGPASV